MTATAGEAILGLWFGRVSNRPRTIGSGKMATCFASYACPARLTSSFAPCGAVFIGTIEQWVKDVKQLLGLGQYQNRSYRAAVIHLHLVCFASALLTHLRIERTGAQGHRTRDKTADLSTAAAQDQLRSLLWEDLIISLKEERHDQPVIEELERLRVA